MRRGTVLGACALATGLVTVTAASCTIYGYGTTALTEAGAVDATTEDAHPDASEEELEDAGDAASDAKGCLPGMIATSTGCIDAFEVTVDDYATFVTAKAGNMSGQQPECAWNATYAPQIDGGAIVGSAPVGFVDWCDAFAYCVFNGKRLCGKVGGGAVAINAYADAGQDEWFAACSHADDGQHLYPYGNTFDASTCNVGGGGRAPVGSYSGCVGGYPGLFDMSGNVQEWSNSCDDGGTDAAANSCRVRGGAYQSAAAATCPRDAKDLRSATLERVGFRCCSN